MVQNVKDENVLLARWIKSSVPTQICWKGHKQAGTGVV